MSQEVSIDTDYNGHQLYRDCYLSGSLYIVNGSGHAFFQKTIVHVKDLEPNLATVITRQERKNNSMVLGGFVFHSCTFSANTKKAINYLGTSLGPSSLIVIMQSYLDASINPLGWLEESIIQVLFILVNTKM